MILLTCSSMELAIRLFPSNVNGRVTMAIVNAPSSLATLAITGAAPVPVPPPIPAAIKTISAPLTMLRISSFDASAAARPTSGSPPAPKPLVNSLPNTILFSAFEDIKACLSVLAT